ncbi:hypothetical protein [Sphingomicrobium sediminis]|uniref:Uncharacterized protein n=1 Tax=Sphingomicrobium sediminis TaxID=2950949 RepID=A0A9X2EHV9_9SPHN|nr:hypothetical protein [Sphingomicrobium sediminis]MCM8558333.1 hypothetical protein [Sphingomicrobium sediminis]
MRKRIGATGGLILLCMAGTSAAQQVQDNELKRLDGTIRAQPTELTAPQISRASIPQRAVILRADNQARNLQTLPVQRRLNQQQLRAQPVIQLEQGEANLRPVLENPASPINLADRLRARPQLATVRADTIELAEIPQGIVVRQFIAYQIDLGTCTNAASRRAVEEQGVECFDRATPQTREAAFADPESARYIENPRERRRAARQAERAISRQQAEIDGDIAQLRQMLADPAQRAQIEAEIGAAETRRLASLDDEALQAELVNNAEVEVEEVMFVPNVEPTQVRFQARQDFGQVDTRARAQAVTRLADTQPAVRTSPVPPDTRPTDIKAAPRPINPVDDFAAAPMLDIAEDIPIETKSYLTGFTLGRQHEWSRRVSITVKWCLIGCKRTYYLEPYAGFGYGFGLRFPLRVEGTYVYRHQNGQERAFLVPEFTPFNGNATQYGETGLPQSKRFNGQELVAEAQAYAGLLYKLPAGISGDVGFNVGVDLTDRLPDPFRNGQFTPPGPGQVTDPVTRTITQVDLIGNRANFYVVGAKIHPAVKFELTSNGIAFKLRDHVAGSDQWMTQSGDPYELALNDAHRSRFSISDPVYNLAFLMTPGIEGRVYVDVAVWSRTWKWPVWFPQLAVQLPPGGVNFACHAQTVCSNSHDIRAAHWSPQPRPPGSTTTRPGARPTVGTTTVPARANPPRASTQPERAATQPDRASDDDMQEAAQPQRATTRVIARPANQDEQEAAESQRSTAVVTARPAPQMERAADDDDR